MLPRTLIGQRTDGPPGISGSRGSPCPISETGRAEDHSLLRRAAVALSGDFYLLAETATPRARRFATRAPVPGNTTPDWSRRSRTERAALRQPCTAGFAGKCLLRLSHQSLRPRWKDGGTSTPGRSIDALPAPRSACAGSAIPHCALANGTRLSIAAAPWTVALSARPPGSALLPPTHRSVEERFPPKPATFLHSRRGLFLSSLWVQLRGTSWIWPYRRGIGPFALVSAGLRSGERTSCPLATRRRAGGWRAAALAERDPSLHLPAAGL